MKAYAIVLLVVIVGCAYAAQCQAAFPPPCVFPPRPIKLSSPLPDALQEALANFNASLATFLSHSFSASMHATVVYDQETIFSQGYGTTELNGGSVPTEDSIYRIGSVTKRGVVHFDDPVSTVEPSYKPINLFQKGGRGATLRDLASHLAGLPRYGPCTFGDCNITSKEAFARIAKWSLISPVGYIPSYSNAGFSVLGRVLESPAGQAYEEFVEKNVYAPLGMTSSAFTCPDMSRLAHGYSNGKPADLYDLGWSNPAGGMYSTGADMVKFMKLFFRDNVASGSSPDQILDGATLRKWVNEIMYDNPGSVPSESVYFTSWGAPWEIFTANTPTLSPNVPAYRFITKDGSVPGYNTFFAMQPKLKLGVYVAQAVGKARSDSPNNGVTLDMTNVLMPALGALIAKLEPPPAVPSNSNDYVGTFVSSAAGASLTLSVDPTTGGVVGVANSQLEVPTKAVPRAWDQPEGSVDTMAAALGLTNADAGTSFSLNWIGADSFQLPQTSGETCGVYENGMTFNWVFQRNGNNEVTAFTVQGNGVYPYIFNKQ